METAEDAQDNYDKSFIDVPAILDKHKAAAVICDGKKQFQNKILRINEYRYLSHKIDLSVF
tara:strand:- start:1090 stop:1272 length:183 start_codon:yes stop_codon:yes gene_type:complete